MREETRSDIGCICLIVFIACLFLCAWVRCENQIAYKKIEQYNEIVFDIEPTEVIEPKCSYVVFNYDGMHYVVHKSYWDYMTGVRNA